MEQRRSRGLRVWSALCWAARIGIVAALYFAWRSWDTGDWSALAVSAGAAIVLLVIQRAAARAALGWVMDDQGERQKIDFINRGRAIFNPTTHATRINAEAHVRSARRKKMILLGIPAFGLEGSAFYIWQTSYLDYTDWAHPVFWLALLFGLPFTVQWLWLLGAELAYQSGWQDMIGAKVLDQPPVRAGLGEVTSQKVHGDARLATEAEALALLCKGKGVTPESAIYLGDYTNRAEPDARAPLLYDGERHLLLFGPNGSGKGTGLLMPNLLRMKDRSLIVIDPKGELAAVTSPYRREVGDVVILNPFELHGLENKGFNPLAALDPDSRTFFDDCAGIAEALIKIEERDPHWSESAQALVTAVVMWEVKVAKANNRLPLLKNVRMLMTEGDYFEPDRKGKPKLAGGFRYTVQRMIDEGGDQIESLISRFQNDSKEIDSVQSTADRQTSWILSQPMSESLARDDVNFSDLKKSVMTVYVVLPAERMRTHSVWLRLLIVSALRALYRPGGLKTLFMIDEFAVLGHLGPIEDAFGLVRGYSVQMWPVLQDKNQLSDIYKTRWQSFVGNCGVVHGFAPGPGDTATAGWMSEMAGDTTAVAAGYNAGDSASTGKQSQSQGMSYQQTLRKLFLPQELRNFPKGNGIIFPAETSLSITYATPPYWDIPECKERAAPNPYYEGS